MDDRLWLALRDVCLRGVATIDPLDAAALVAKEFARVTPRGVAATAEGRAALEAWARLPDGSDGHAAARRAYDAFLPLDLEVKEAATAWQTIGAAKQDPLGLEGWKIVDQVRAIDERSRPPLRRLAEAAPRFACYPVKLREALRRVEDGEREYMTGLLVDSFHTTWWHLHQDLLWALGINRADDPNQ